jgi:hypothetical protein
MEMREGTTRPAGTERRDVVRSIRLKPSTDQLIVALAKKEEHSVADMLRLLIQDGYRVRTGQK